MTTGKDFGNTVGAILVGIVGGIVAAAILDAITTPKCPICKQNIQQGAPVCPNCGRLLQWTR